MHVSNHNKFHSIKILIEYSWGLSYILQLLNRYQTKSSFFDGYQEKHKETRSHQKFPTFFVTWYQHRYQEDVFVVIINNKHHKTNSFYFHFANQRQQNEVESFLPIFTCYSPRSFICSCNECESWVMMLSWLWQECHFPQAIILSYHACELDNKLAPHLRCI